MAATVTRVGAGAKEMDPYVCHEFEVSSITSGESVTVTHGGPTGFKAAKVEFECVTPPTALHLMGGYHVKASDTTTATIVKFLSELGGDPDGAVWRVRIYFYGGKSGGISAA